MYTSSVISKKLRTKSLECEMVFDCDTGFKFRLSPKNRNSQLSYEVCGCKDSKGQISGLYCIKEYHNNVAIGFMIYSFKDGKLNGPCVGSNVYNKIGFWASYEDDVQIVGFEYSHNFIDVPTPLDSRVLKLYSDSLPTWVPSFREVSTR